MSEFASLIRDVPDFPEPGIVFKDITPLLADPEAFAGAIGAMAEPFRAYGIDKVAGIEARGFVFAPSVAERLDVGFVPIRKAGKLPGETTAVTYELEYGTDTLEVHSDGIEHGDRVLLVDDVLATGGTMAAACSLVDELGGETVGVSVLIELFFLNGRKLLQSHNVHAAIGSD